MVTMPFTALIVVVSVTLSSTSVGWVVLEGGLTMALSLGVRVPSNQRTVHGDLR